MKNCKIIFQVIIIGMVAFLLLGCEKSIADKNIEINGTTISTVREEFPQIDGVISCKWTYKKLTIDSRIAVGPESYSFYGEMELSSEYYNKIISEYKWEKFKDKTFVEYIDNISNDKNVYISDLFISNMSNKTYVKLLLEKENKTLYFYRED